MALKSRIAIVSCEGSSLSWWARLRSEGADVRVYIAPWAQSHVGDGLIPKAGSYEELQLWAAQGPTTWLFDGSGEGKKAQALRDSGQIVVGAGAFCDRLEHDRTWAQRVAAVLGIKTPSSKDFSTITEAIRFLMKQDDESSWYWKTDVYLASDATHGGTKERLIRYLEYAKTRWKDNVSCLLQEKIEGIAVSTGGWWNGQTWLHPLEGTLEHKKFSVDELGPATGCAFNSLWFYKGTSKIEKALQFEALGYVMREAKAPPGIYDINSVVSKKDKQPYFLEFTPRFGYDSEPTSQRSLTMSMTEFIIRLGEGTLYEAPFATDVVQTTVRLSVPPYPYEEVEKIPEKKGCVGTPVWGADGLFGAPGKHFIAYGLGLDEQANLVVKDPLGMVGLVAASGLSMQTMEEEILDYAEEELQIPGLNFRTDFAKVIARDLEQLRDLGYESHPELDLEV